ATCANFLQYVGARENQPIVPIEIAQRVVERLIRFRRNDLDDRDLNRNRAERTQLFTEFGSLAHGARHQYAPAGERQGHCETPGAAASKGPAPASSSIRAA